MQDIVGNFFAWLLLAVANPPGSAVFVIFVSVTISSISNVAMMKLTDMRSLKRHQAEIKQFQEMEKRAKETGNEKLLRKVKRRKPYIDRIQREQMTQRCKPQLIFIIPFMFVFAYLRGFYSFIDPGTGLSQDLIVAVLPFNAGKALPFLEGFIGVTVDGGFGMFFWSFYFLVGLGLGQVLQRIMGVNVMTT